MESVGEIMGCGHVESNIVRKLNVIGGSYFQRIKSKSQHKEAFYPVGVFAPIFVPFKINSTQHFKFFLKDPLN